MKKKIMILAMFIMFTFVLASCDFLSTVMAVKGFYEEYNTYSDVYNDATQFTVLTETTLTISETTVEEGLDEVDSRVYVMLDKNSEFVYIEQRLLEIDKASVYEESGDLFIEYVIGEGDVVVPTLPTPEERIDTDVNTNIFKEDFDIQSVQNENKTGDHTYEMDVYLNQAINLDELSDFVDQLAIFGGDLSSFDDALAHVVVTFTEQDSVIDLTVTLTDYTITFEDETFVTLSLSSHVVISSPENFEMPNVFAAPYQMVAVDDIDLARRAYGPDEVINYPAVTGASGYAKLVLTPGVYQVASLNMSNFTFVLYDTDENAVDMTSPLIVTEETTYYLYITPLADFQSDIYMEQLEDHSVTTTTEVVTTETQTTTASE